MSTSFGKRWQLCMMFRGRTGQMYFQGLAFSIDAFKFIKDEVEGTSSRMVYTDGGEIPSL
jgi:hypothetical protein